MPSVIAKKKLLTNITADMKKLLTSATTTLLFVLYSAPAHAVTVQATKPRRFWYYWPGIALAVGIIFIFVALAIGYYVKVVRPRVRSR